MKSVLYIANWKMQLSYAQAVSFASTYKDALIKLAQHDSTEIVLCPSPEALASITALFRNTNIDIGAQDCSSFETGAYTGEVSVQSLHDLSISYALVGHSERRLYHHETNQESGKKAALLLSHGITPIICIGEQIKEDSIDVVYDFLSTQIEELLQNIINREHNIPRVCFAYEPRWAIGTGQVPEISFLVDLWQKLHAFLKKEWNAQAYRLLYGGSVTASYAHQMKMALDIHGFLIGSASLDFQKFQNIVLS